MHSFLSPISNKPIIHQHVAVCGSTNSELMHNLNANKIDKSKPYLLTADVQTAGRGQRDRSWQSPLGNIYLSLYHPLQIPLSGLLSLVVGYHLTGLPIIQQMNRQRQAVNLPIIGVKWANDIGYYGINNASSQFEPDSSGPNQPDNCSQPNSFNKLAGILIEPVMTNNQITGVIVGVGINIETAPILSNTAKERMDYQAVSLTQIIKETQKANKLQLDFDSKHKTYFFPKAKDLYRPVSATIVRAINQFISFHSDTYKLPEFIKKYDQVSILTGLQVQVIQRAMTDPNLKDSQKAQSRTVIGKVIGINADGCLLLKTEENTNPIPIYTGTIRLI